MGSGDELTGIQIVLLVTPLGGSSYDSLGQSASFNSEKYISKDTLHFIIRINVAISV